MRVTFIIPPSGFLLDERVFPTLGVLKVAAVLEQVGHEVDVLDLSGIEHWESVVDSHLATNAPEVYGLTATMPQMPQAAEIAQHIKAWHLDARLVLGGPHVTLMQASARQERARGEHGRACKAMDQLASLFDVLVCGDGERAMPIAIGDDPPALIDGDDPKSDLFLKSADLDAAPFAARHLIDLNSYHYAIDGVRATSTVLQLGCPYQCAFCGGRRSPFLRKIRTRSTASAIAEIRHLYETYGLTGFMFFDDELNVNRQFHEFLTQLVLLQSDLGVAFRLRGFLKAELITDVMAAGMRQAGFRQVLVGFESGSPQILANIRKQATVTDNTRAVDILHKHGLQVKAAMSVGHPGESRETLKATKRWLLEVQPDEFDVSVITVYPGTPYFDDARESQPGVWTYVDPKSGDQLHARNVDQLTDVNFYKGTPGSYQSFVWSDHLSAADIVAGRDEIEADVRSALKLAYPTSAAAIQYEHSMGMPGRLGAA